MPPVWWSLKRKFGLTKDSVATPNQLVFTFTAIRKNTEAICSIN